MVGAGDPQGLLCYHSRHGETREDAADAEFVQRLYQHRGPLGPKAREMKVDPMGPCAAPQGQECCRIGERVHAVAAGWRQQDLGEEPKVKGESNVLPPLAGVGEIVNGAHRGDGARAARSMEWRVLGPGGGEGLEPRGETDRGH